MGGNKKTNSSFILHLHEQKNVVSMFLSDFEGGRSELVSYFC